MRLDLFETFLGAYTPSTSVPCDHSESGSEVDLLLSKLGGRTFNDGIYRTHTHESSERWTRIVASAFLDFESGLQCFGYDWLGRQFAIDTAPDSATFGLVFQFDIDECAIYSIKQTLIDFHNIELVQFSNDVVAAAAFQAWSNSTAGARLELNECIGFIIPLLLGGKDDLANQERINMEVYWETHAQLWSQAKQLPEGTSITAITVDGRLP